MKLIDADALKIDMEETVFDGDGTYKVYGYSSYQIKRAPTITPPPNDPLTLDELRKMDDMDVWVMYPVDFSRDQLIMHALVEFDRESEKIWLTNNLDGRSTFDEIVEDGAVVYRRKPEES